MAKGSIMKFSRNRRASGEDYDEDYVYEKRKKDKNKDMELRKMKNRAYHPEDFEGVEEFEDENQYR